MTKNFDDAELRDRLTPEQYEVTQNAGTERAFTHESFPAGPGTFTCTCCGAELFDKAHKFDSGTGWPCGGSSIARASRPSAQL